jgi:polar amino acid transport system substrate-binding protein
MRKSLLCLMVLLSCMAPASALPVCPEHPIQLAYYEYAPFYHDGAGLDADVVDELKKRSGCAFSTILMPRARIWKSIEVGTLDMTGSGIETSERTRFGYFFPYILQKNFALVSRQIPADVRSLQDFIARTDLRWGVVRDFSYGEYYDPLLKELRRQNRIHELPTQIATFRMMQAGRIAGMLAVPMIYKELLPEMQATSAVRIADWAPEDLPVRAGLVLSRARFSEAEAQEWGALIESMNRDGTMLRLLGKYLPPKEAQAALPQKCKAPPVQSGTKKCASY